MYNNEDFSEFYKLLKTAKKKELQAFAQLLMPFIADLEIRTPRVWGDRNKVHLDEATISINDLFINTRSGHVKIGKDCFFGHRCMLLTGTHDYSQTGLNRLNTVPSSGRDIVIEEGAWLGSGVIVLGPCKIGKHSVVASGSLVTKDVPDFTVVAGHPARPIKRTDGTYNL